ncbi:unnamed protein product [Pleuronectes platessa]|uniref:Uncharacterized protein n=1 Tax=Pleuronectes platessa TaxID=8262 RepID=A0A9N7Y5U1_PLEPL|nr:unnamed protein product [Pleuronectes platessa]
MKDLRNLSFLHRGCNSLLLKELLRDPTMSCRGSSGKRKLGQPQSHLIGQHLSLLLKYFIAMQGIDGAASCVTTLIESPHSLTPLAVPPPSSNPLSNLGAAPGYSSGDSETVSCRK